MQGGFPQGAMPEGAGGGVAAIPAAIDTLIDTFTTLDTTSKWNSYGATAPSVSGGS